MDITLEFITLEIISLLTLVFGFWLSLAGKPYNGILFNIHKLIALGGVIVTVIQLSKMLKTADSLALIITLLVLAGICVVALAAGHIHGLDFGTIPRRLFLQRFFAEHYRI